MAPATIARDDRGGATLRATRLTSPLTLDGRLSEEIYRSVPAASGFIQQVPREGEPATEQTELWVFFDDVNLYIVARCLDSQPEREIATELRRDNSGLVQNESISVVIDTFYDRRNGFTFQTGPRGGRGPAVNLTWFSLFFPEKREFFLEGQGIFAFGGAPLQSSGGINRDIAILFFSRRIGLSQGQTVPVVAGGRLTGRAGAYTIGAINIQTAEEPSVNAPATNFSIVRLKRDILRRSTVGLIATRRDPSGAGEANTAGGVDLNLAFFDSLNWTSYYARTTPGMGESVSSSSYRSLLDYGGDRYWRLVRVRLSA